MKKPRWTDAQKAVLRAEYGRTPTDDLAVKLGRTPQQVRQAAKRFCDLTPHNRLEDYEADIRRLHALGKSQERIARELRLPRRTVEFWWPRLGLQANGWSAEARKFHKCARRRQKVLQNAGLIGKVLWCSCPMSDSDPRLLRVGSWQDLFQECLLYVLTSVHNYDKAKGKFSTWMSVMTKFYARRLLSSGGLIRVPTGVGVRSTDLQERVKAALCVAPLDSTLVWRPGEDGRQTQAAKEDAEHLAWCLTRLTRDARRLLTKRFVDGLSVKELSGLTYRPMAKLEEQIDAALGKLRRLYWGDDRPCPRSRLSN